MLIRAALFACLLLFSPAGRAEDAVLALLAQPGSVGLLRHARAPGTGDPPGLRLDDCNTQRNLSEAGRAQARAAGAALRAAGLSGARILSSEWCRTRETAELLALGPVEIFPALNSFVRAWNDEPAQTAALRTFLAAERAGRPLILVTHQVNITALTGVYPAEGEMVVLRPGAHGYDVVGRVRLD